MISYIKHVTYQNNTSDVENKLINEQFVRVCDVSGDMVPDEPGLYCIKLLKGVWLPDKYGKVREDGIIYMGLASISLYQRF